MTERAEQSERLSGDDVFAIVTGAVARVLELDPATLVPTTSLAADLGADSLALVEIAEIVEEQLAPYAASDFRIADDDLDGLATIGAAVDYVMARL